MSDLWLTIDADDAGVHAVPTCDEAEHQLTTVCPCGPRVEILDRVVVTHMAFDGRHLVEQAAAILTQRQHAEDR